MWKGLCCIPSTSITLTSMMTVLSVSTAWVVWEWFQKLEDHCVSLSTKLSNSRCHWALYEHWMYWTNRLALQNIHHLTCNSYRTCGHLLVPISQRKVLETLPIWVSQSVKCHTWTLLGQYITMHMNSKHIEDQHLKQVLWLFTCWHFMRGCQKFLASTTSKNVMK